MQYCKKLVVTIAVLAVMILDSSAIDCYYCDGPKGEIGGCGQDPFLIKGIAPAVNIIRGTDICFVSLILISKNTEKDKIKLMSSWL